MKGILLHYKGLILFSHSFCNKASWKVSCLRPLKALLHSAASSFLCTVFFSTLLVPLCCVFSALSSVHAEQTVGLLTGAGGLRDQSFNDMTFTGLGKAQQEYHFNLIVEETQNSYKSRETALKRLLERGSDIIVANGSGLEKQVMTCSHLFPDRFFLVNDVAIEGYQNISSTVFAHEEGAYLVGLLAASLTRTGTIGFIGGVDRPETRSFLNGYLQGGQSFSPSVHIDIAFLTTGDDLSGYENPVLGSEIATKMYKQGSDIIFSVAGLTGNGIIQAAVKQNKFVIGVDADQDHMAKGHVITSMMKRLDIATYREIVNILKGEFQPGVKHYNLENGGVCLTPMRYSRHLLSDVIMQRINKAQNDIINGTIEIEK